MKTITVTVKDDARKAVIDGLVQCFTILCEVFEMDAVIVYEEKDIQEDKDAAQ